MLHTVRTNKIGDLESNWAGKVAYRVRDINAAWNMDADLECLVANEHPMRMVIPHDEIYKRINHRRHFKDSKYGDYELAYYLWVPNFDGEYPIEPKPIIIPDKNQKKLF